MGDFIGGQPLRKTDANPTMFQKARICFQNEFRSDGQRCGDLHNVYVGVKVSFKRAIIVIRPVEVSLSLNGLKGYIF
jgi:hypothetical protein